MDAYHALKLKELLAFSNVSTVLSQPVVIAVLTPILGLASSFVFSYILEYLILLLSSPISNLVKVSTLVYIELILSILLSSALLFTGISILLSSPAIATLFIYMSITLYLLVKFIAFNIITLTIVGANRNFGHIPEFDNTIYENRIKRELIALLVSSVIIGALFYLQSFVMQQKEFTNLWTVITNTPSYGLIILVTGMLTLAGTKLSFEIRKHLNLLNMHTTLEDFLKNENIK